MFRITVAALCWALLSASPLLAQTTEERVERLERLLEEQRERYERELDELRGRIVELEGTEEESELDRLLREAAEEADAAYAEEPMQPSGDSLFSGRTLQNAFNPRITVFGDFVYRNDSHDVFAEAPEDDQEAAQLDDRFSLRSLELDLRADVDPFAKAVAILGLHEEAPGEYHFDLEEAYLTLETLPWGLRGKIGKYLADMGKFNRLHSHDWPQTSAPLYYSEYFGPEGLNVVGADLSWLVPQSGVDALEVEAGIYDGGTQLAPGDDFTYLGRIQAFENLSDSAWLSLGSSGYWGKTDDDGDDSVFMGGFDLLFRWRPTEDQLSTSFFLQSEAYWLRRETEEGTTKSFGGFVAAQYQPIRDLYFGLRLDYVEPLNQFVTEVESVRALGVWATYYTSEFLRFRLGYQHDGPRGGGRELGTFRFQVTWVFGSHPVEPYWVNK